MTQRDLLEILKRYNRGECTFEEKLLIDTWYDRIGVKDPIKLSLIEEETLKSTYLSKIEKHINQKGAHLQGRQRAFNNWQIIKLAAVISVLACCAFIYLLLNDLDGVTETSFAQSESVPLEEVVNSGVNSLVYELPDKSTVILQPGGSLKFNSRFSDTTRKVFLEGEAFFNVTRNVNRPFVVYAKDLVTKVLGTSFSIKPDNLDGKIVVSVRSGKVSVSSNNADALHKPSGIRSAETILIPNQQAVYNQKTKEIKRLLVESPVQLVKPDAIKKIRFEDAPIAEILNSLEEIYGVDIAFDEKKLKHCRVTTVITEGGIFNRLGIICKAIRATYTIEDAKIIIVGPGCD